MTIDIEGLEYDALSVFDMKSKGPKIVTMELDTNKERMENFLIEQEYFLYLKIFSNQTWIKNEWRKTIFD